MLAINFASALPAAQGTILSCKLVSRSWPDAEPTAIGLHAVLRNTKDNSNSGIAVACFPKLLDLFEIFPFHCLLPKMRERQ